MTYATEIPGGAAWSMPVRAGRLVTLTALADNANASLLLFGPDHLDRMNIPDTLKSQMSACIKAPMVLMSDRGLALASVVDSTLGWHDCLGGFGHDRHLERFGPTSYAADRNEWRRSARTGLVSELTKHGLSESDLHGCVNFFSKLAIDDRSGLTYVPGHAKSGDTVTLRTELDVIVVLSTAPHPLSPLDYAPAGVRVDLAVAPTPAEDDPSRLFRDESARALEMSGRVLA